MKLFDSKFRVTILVLAAFIVIGALVYNSQIQSVNSTENPEHETDSTNGITWLGFNEGLSKAAKEKKLVLIDVYTDWCIWCKEMDKNVYTDKSVIDYMNKHYVPVKLNAESKNIIK